MRYMVVDLKGNQRGSFDSRAELEDELREGAEDDPSALAALYVLAYDDEGNEVTPAERADAFLAGSGQSGSGRAFLFDFVTHTVRPVFSPESDRSYQEVRGRAALAGQAE